MSSLASAKATALRGGPVIVDVLGYGVPVLPALVAVVGTSLAAFIAPPDPRLAGRAKRGALVVLLCMVSVALTVAGTQSILVATSWSIGIGYAGLPLVAIFKDIVLRRGAQLAGEDPDPAPAAAVPNAAEPPAHSDVSATTDSAP